MERVFIFLQIFAFALFIIFRSHPNPYIVGFYSCTIRYICDNLEQFNDDDHREFLRGVDDVIKYKFVIRTVYNIMLCLSMWLWFYTIPVYLHHLFFKKWNWYRLIILNKQAESMYFETEEDKQNFIREKMK